MSVQKKHNPTNERVTIHPDLLRKVFEEKELQVTTLSEEMGRNFSYISTCMNKGTMEKNAYKLMLKLMDVTEEDVTPKPEVPSNNVTIAYDGPSKAEFEQLAKFIIDMRKSIKEVAEYVIDIKTVVDEMVAWKEVEAEEIEKIRKKLCKHSVSLEKIKEKLQIPSSPAD